MRLIVDCPVSPVSRVLLQAYSVYDEEIGYCQGQSFLAAVLLLHVSSYQLKEGKESFSLSNILKSSGQIFDFGLTEVYSSPALLGYFHQCSVAI